MKYYDRAYVIASDTGCVSAGLFLSHGIPFRDARLIVERYGTGRLGERGRNPARPAHLQLLQGRRADEHGPVWLSDE
jgi:hypothetical protein